MTRYEFDALFENEFDKSLELEAEAMEIASRLPLPPGPPPGFETWVRSVASGFHTERDPE